MKEMGAIYVTSESPMKNLLYSSQRARLKHNEVVSRNPIVDVPLK